MERILNVNNQFENTDNSAPASDENFLHRTLPVIGKHGFAFINLNLKGSGKSQVHQGRQLNARRPAEVIQ